MKIIFRSIDKILPHDRDFNMPYTFKFTTNSKLKCHSFYTIPDEKDMAGFTITINLLSRKVRLSFDKDKRTRYLYQKYMLNQHVGDIVKEYFEDYLD